MWLLLLKSNWVGRQEVQQQLNAACLGEDVPAELVTAAVLKQQQGWLGVGLGEYVRNAQKPARSSRILLERLAVPWVLKWLKEQSAQVQHPI